MVGSRTCLTQPHRDIEDENKERNRTCCPLAFLNLIPASFKLPKSRKPRSESSFGSAEDSDSIPMRRYRVSSDGDSAVRVRRVLFPESNGIKTGEVETCNGNCSEALPETRGTESSMALTRRRSVLDRVRRDLFGASTGANAPPLTEEDSEGNFSRGEFTPDLESLRSAESGTPFTEWSNPRYYLGVVDNLPRPEILSASDANSEVSQEISAVVPRLSGLNLTHANTTISRLPR